jgi:hypothetical protein
MTLLSDHQPRPVMLRRAVRTDSFRAMRLLTGFIFILVCIPNINFFFFLKGVNTQPVSALVIALYYVLNTRKLFASKFANFFFYLLLLILSHLFILFSLSVLGSGQRGGPGFYTYELSMINGVLTFIAYLIGPLILLYFSQNFRYLSARVLQFSVLIQVVVVVIQFSGVSFLQNSLAAVLDPVLINYNPTVLTDIGRGASGTYVEPSHLARYAILFIVLSTLLNRTGALSKPQMVVLIGLSTFLLLASQAITGIGIFALFGIAVVVKSLLQGKFSPFLSAAIIGSLILGALSLSTENTRLHSIYAKVDQVRRVVDHATVLDLQILGGIRMINTVIGYKAITKFPFGQGLGSYLTTMYNTAYLVNVRLEDTNLYRSIRAGKQSRMLVTKPQGVGSQYSYDFGILGIIAIIFLIIPVLKHFLFERRSAGLLGVAPAVGLVLILFLSTTTLPMPWLLVATMTIIPGALTRKPASAKTE